MEPDGRSNFNNLLFRRDWPCFYAFDLLALDGRDLRTAPLLDRLLVKALPKIETRLLYLGDLVERGRDLYDLACQRDLEGGATKWAHGIYQPDGVHTSGLKIKNAAYTQALGRRESFEARRDRRQRQPGHRTPELRLA